MFGNLHSHLDTSNTRGFMDSTNRIDKLLPYAKELGHVGIAITDHDTIAAHMRVLDFIEEQRKQETENTPDDYSWRNFKVALGNEIYLCSRREITEEKNYHFYHFILVAKDKIGHQQIRELSTRAWTENSFYWVNIRTPTYYDDLFEVVGKNPGHLIASTACLAGHLPFLINRAYYENPLNPNFSKCKQWISKMVETFGEGNFYLEIQPSIQKEQEIINKYIVQLSEETGVPFIITTDCHYLKKEDRPIHEAFLKSDAKGGENREVGDFYATTYMMSEEEIHEYLDPYLGAEKVQKGLDTSASIFSKIEDYSLDNPLRIPYEPDDLTEPNIHLVQKYWNAIPSLKTFFESPYDSDRHLVREIVNRIEKDSEELANPETYKAIETCLNVIKITSDKMQTQWSAYLLQTRKFIDAIWEAGSLSGPSRGSGGGFILLYILGIIQINPLREEVPLYYWRFLHEYRASVLDVDCDCEGSKRDAIIKILQEKYGGPRRVCKVQTLLTLKSKAAILVACRGLGISTEEASFLASFITADRGIQRNLHQTFYGDEVEGLAPDTEFRKLMEGKYSDVWRIAQEVEGLISGVSQHAGGVILSPKDIVNYTALMRSSSGDIITQYDLHKAEKAGLIKWDLLGIDALQKEHICLDLLLEDGQIEWQGNLKDTYEKYIGVYKIERNNPKIWEMINNHEIMSFFQMEKQSGYQAISIGHPQNLVDLSALNSVMRLMATDGGESPLERYGRFKEDITLWYKEMDSYGLTKDEQEVVKKYAGPTFGLLPNQENFMLAVQDPELGGMNLLWADKLRKSIANFLAC